MSMATMALSWQHTDQKFNHEDCLWKRRKRFTHKNKPTLISTVLDSDCIRILLGQWIRIRAKISPQKDKNEEISCLKSYLLGLEASPGARTSSVRFKKTYRTVSDKKVFCCTLFLSYKILVQSDPNWIRIQQQPGYGSEFSETELISISIVRQLRKQKNCSKKHNNNSICAVPG